MFWHGSAVSARIVFLMMVVIMMMHVNLLVLELRTSHVTHLIFACTGPEFENIPAKCNTSVNTNTRRGRSDLVIGILERNILIEQ